MAGQLSVNGTPATGAVTVQTSDVVTVSPGAGTFPNGVLVVYLMSGATRTARVSFVSGLLSIAVTPNAPSIPKGLTQQFVATGTFSDTSTADLTNSVSWTSGTPTVATVSATSGLATSVAVGSTIITATLGSVSGSTTLTITSATLKSMSIAPNPAFSGIGLPRQLTATGMYSDASTQNVTTAANWTSSTPSVATVGPTTGLATSVSLGPTTISAAIGSVSATASLTIVSQVWSPTGSLSTARRNHTATLLPNGKVLVAGGSSDLFYNSTSDAELYDPASGTWSPTGSLLCTLQGQVATLLPNGKVLLIGGFSNAGCSLSTQLYDPVAGTWSAAASLLVQADSASATLLSTGQVLATSGTTAELYDPDTNTWSPTGNLVTPHGGFTATLLTNGKVLVAAGDDSTNNPGTNAELYDPVSGTWSLTGSLSTARLGHTATLLPSGQVLVAGGNIYTAPSGYPVTSSAELYDPVLGAWSPTGSLETGRSNHTATLLSNSVVLVAGGTPPASAATV
jgi:hypothetical protein